MTDRLAGVLLMLMFIGIVLWIGREVSRPPER